MALSAPEFCTRAATLMEERGKDRDKPSGERSMSRCVEAFNAMTGHQLTEEEGWLFMVYLKHSRMQAGAFRRDDYEDAVAYGALMAEAAVASQKPLKEVPLKVSHNCDRMGSWNIGPGRYPEDPHV